MKPQHLAEQAKLYNMVENMRLSKGVQCGGESGKTNEPMIFPPMIYLENQSKTNEPMIFPPMIYLGKGMVVLGIVYDVWQEICKAPGDALRGFYCKNEKRLQHITCGTSLHHCYCLDISNSHTCCGIGT
jgi:hypothetical protein